jgi:hypothetical protein
MIRKICASALFFLVLGFAAAADWKAELLSFFGPRPDFHRALEYLTDQVKSMGAADLQTAQALLPYLAWKVGDTTQEQDLIADYFEKYQGSDPEFGFLDDITHRDFLIYWARWKITFPLVSDVNFLAPAEGGVPGLPAGLEIGLELLNPAYYKISLGPYILEGGFWSRGSHIVTVPVSGLFERSGTYEFALDLKAGDIVLRKPIKVEVNLTGISSLRSPTPVLPPVPGGVKSGQAPPATTNLEGELSLYVGGKLIMTSRKIAVKPRPLTFRLPGPSMPGQKPYLPPPRTDPMANSVSILDAIALTYKTLKGLLAKKAPVPSPPSYQKVASLSFSFARTASNGSLSDVRADVRLEKTRTTVLRQ